MSRQTGLRRATGLVRPAKRENSPRAPTPTSARAGRALTVLRAHTSRATGRAAATKLAAHAKRLIFPPMPTRTPADVWPIARREAESQRMALQRATGLAWRAGRERFPPCRLLRARIGATAWGGNLMVNTPLINL